MHKMEFVKPVEDILKKNKQAFFTKNYKEITQKDLDKAKKVIICGTSLRDNGFIFNENLHFWMWIRDFNKPLLGICGGMQIIGKIFRANVCKETEIGFYKERFHKEFLGLNDWHEVYHLHNYYSDFSNIDEFEVCCSSDSEIAQAVRHTSKKIYGVLFHPEVRQKQLIENFSKL